MPRRGMVVAWAAAFALAWIAAGSASAQGAAPVGIWRSGLPGRNITLRYA